MARMGAAEPDDPEIIGLLLEGHPEQGPPTCGKSSARSEAEFAGLLLLRPANYERELAELGIRLFL